MGKELSKSVSVIPKISVDTRSNLIVYFLW